MRFMVLIFTVLLSLLLGGSLVYRSVGVEKPIWYSILQILFSLALLICSFALLVSSG